jgi:SNF2 family DNA or RNA helicase
LTLIEANHVIHYGRWWTPALEAQAADRVYRIGQTRPVHVYYPIAVDPLKQFVSFDEKLERIIKRRRRMAEDFLTPLPSEEEFKQELLCEVLTSR